MERQSRDAGAGNCNGGRGVYQIFCCGTPVGNATRQTSVQKCFDRLYSAMKLRYGCFTLTMKVVVVAQLIYLIYSNEIDHLQKHVSDYIKDAVVFQIISWNDMRGTMCLRPTFYLFLLSNTKYSTKHKTSSKENHETRVLEYFDQFSNKVKSLLIRNLFNCSIFMRNK